jgi:uncharacterized membrane protein
MRLQELHPALVHFPIALLPTSLAADALGRWTGNPGLMDLGRRTIPLAAASAALAGVAGLIAQESSRIADEAHEALVTHRTLNVGLTAAAAALAALRWRRERPGLGYLLAGLAGTAVLFYSASLGGKMVYHSGVGVSAADGLKEDQAPEIRPGNARQVAGLSARHIRDGLAHAVDDLREGKAAPALSHSAGA